VREVVPVEFHDCIVMSDSGLVDVLNTKTLTVEVLPALIVQISTSEAGCGLYLVRPFHSNTLVQC
jgi:hypothetical protein